jgi:hypothetical protein
VARTALEGAPAGGRIEQRGAAALARAVTDRRVLARDPAPVTPQPQSSADTWASSQSEWEAVVAARDAMETAATGTTLRLGGNDSIDLVAGPDTLAAVRRACRHRLMEILYLVWNSYRGGALSDARSAADPATSMVTLQATVLGAVKPIFQALEAGLPAEERFEYSYPDPAVASWTSSVRDTVAIVAGLIAQSSAEAARADPTKAHDEAKKIVGDADWCGAFAYDQFAGAGVDVPATALGKNPLAWTGPYSGGIGIDGFFQYRPALEIKVGDDWIDVQTYHQTRGSLRRFQVLPVSGTEAQMKNFEKETKQYEGGTVRGGQVPSLDAIDIQPGDLVMIDRAKGTFGDHIAMCRAYDSTTHHLWTIGGNEGQPHPVNASGMWELDKNAAPSSVEGDAKSSRVYAVARFSAVDFEPHVYRLKK